ICCGFLYGFFEFLLSPTIDALIGEGGSTMSAHPAGVFIYAGIPSGFVGAILGFMVGALQIPKKLSAAIGGLLGLFIALSFGIAAVDGLVHQSGAHGLSIVLFIGLTALSFVFAGAITGYVVAALTQIEESAE